MRLLKSAILALTISASGPVFGQQQSYIATNVTGQLQRTAIVNLLQQSQQVQFQQTQLKASTPAVEKPAPTLPKQLHPSVAPHVSAHSALQGAPRAAALAAPQAASLITSMAIGIASSFGFDGITHAEQRLANGGNQFSVEPPSPAIAVANGFILEGVNNALRVYSTAGTPLLPAAVSTNQLFALPPAINRSTGVNGVFPTDMRVFYDQSIDRWFVVQRAQDNDTFGNPVNTSHLYIAVSQTGNPTGTYNIYTIDTTNAQNFGCPCLSDYPQIGADQYGFYISANEFNTVFQQFVDSTVLAISKASLASGAPGPPTFRFTIPFTSGFEFAIQPAATPPGASYLVANGGVEFFLSTQAAFSSDSSVALWAMTNTSSMATASPNLLLTKTLITSLSYIYPDVATQRPGPLAYGSTLTPPGVPAFLDGSDSRMLSVVYSGGRLFLTFASQVIDENNRSVVGGAYMILSPTLRAGVLTASVLRQGYLVVKGNHLLRPAVAVNPQGKGAIAFTLVGPDYFPSAAFVSIDAQTTGSTVQVAAFGTGPEDGFTGYGSPGFPGLARWGDYSGAVAASDGSIWMTTEYIPNLPRTQLANWGTFIMRYVPQ
jgi:hypothetical protein